MTIETCASKFAARGNPWDQPQLQDERDLPGSIVEYRHDEKRHVSLMRASEKSPFKDSPRLIRQLTESEEQAATVRKNMLAVRSLLGNHTRTLAPQAETYRAVKLLVLPARDDELDPWAPEAIEARIKTLAADTDKAKREIAERHEKLFNDYNAVMSASM